MGTFVKSLKRLFLLGKISNEKVSELLISGKITEEEYDYIIRG